MVSKGNRERLEDKAKNIKNQDGPGGGPLWVSTDSTQNVNLPDIQK